MTDHDVRDLALARPAHGVPRDIDLEIARLELASMDIRIDELMPVQAAYLSSGTHGT
jgi:S-adenosylhomocysteine hydrolase